jgi:peptide chain release factor 1
MDDKIISLLAKLPQIEDALGDPSTVLNREKYTELTREHRYLSNLNESYQRLVASRKQLEDNQKLLRSEKDPEFIQMLEDDSKKLENEVSTLEKKVADLLIPPDLTDSCNTILEIRAGTGGDEAAIFVGDCVRMYQGFANAMGWKYELLSCSPSEMGGFKEYVMVLTGENVYRFLKYEGGTHRVQRVPETETQGRVHTSAITMAVLIEPEECDEIKIDEKDLRIDTFRASGAGGQHINTTDSAVRITHIPSGIAVYSMEERSQHKNKAKAMRLLQAKLAEEERKKREAAITSARSSQVGSGDRSEKIRTYNYPQNRITDHRIGLTIYNLLGVMDGDLSDLTSQLVAYFHQKQLESL